MAKSGDRCAVCNLRAHHDHHVVYEQHVRKHGGDPDDPRNLMPLCFQCHGSHHGRSRVIGRHKIPAAALEFADGLLGDYAQDYFARYYRDPHYLRDNYTVSVDGARAVEELSHRHTRYPEEP
jgi:hypothetical protein